MLRKVTNNMGVEENFELLKSENLLYLKQIGKGKIIATFTHDTSPQEIMRECSRHLKGEREAGLL